MSMTDDEYDRLSAMRADVARLTAERDELRAALEQMLCSHIACINDIGCWNPDNNVIAARAILAKTAPVNPNAGVVQAAPRGRWTP